MFSSGLLFQAASQFVLVFAYVYELKYVFLISFYLFVMMYSISLGGIFYIYQVEINPPELVPFASFFKFILNSAMGFFALRLIQFFGIFWLFGIFALVSSLTWIVFEGTAIETRGKSKFIIKKEFEAKKFFQR